MKTLIPMTDFVLQENFSIHHRFFPECVINYAKFLKRHLNLGMFIPCDLEGNILEEPKKENYSIEELRSSDMGVDILNYQEAKERVLFKNSVIIDETPYDRTKRLMINLNHPASFRIYNRFKFHDGVIETEFLPNFSKIPTIEYLVGYKLELTPSALKEIGIKE